MVEIRQATKKTSYLPGHQRDNINIVISIDKWYSLAEPYIA